jgi:hypothetical protein
MVPRSFITNLSNGQHVPAHRPLVVRGIAFGGDAGVRDVKISDDAGMTWMEASLGHDHGKYSFIQWEARLLPKAGPLSLMVKATNTSGVVQPDSANWNASGFMRNVVESVSVKAS